MELRKALTISLILLVAAGCHQKPKKLPTSAPAMTTEWKSSPVGVTASAVMVRQGRSPLVYIVPEPAKVRVVDLSSGKNVAAGPVGAQTLVRIDDEHGVIDGLERFGDLALVAPERLVALEQCVVLGEQAPEKPFIQIGRRAVEVFD